MTGNRPLTTEEIRERLGLLSSEEVERRSRESGWYPRQSGSTTEMIIKALAAASSASEVNQQVAICFVGSAQQYFFRVVIDRYCRKLGIPPDVIVIEYGMPERINRLFRGISQVFRDHFWLEAYDGINSSFTNCYPGMYGADSLADRQEIVLRIVVAAGCSYEEVCASIQCLMSSRRYQNWMQCASCLYAFCSRTGRLPEEEITPMVLIGPISLAIQTRQALFGPISLPIPTNQPLSRQPLFSLSNLGNPDCKFNAHSPVLRCSVNPSGPCEGCCHFVSAGE